jgi:hypothetical protein
MDLDGIWTVRFESNMRIVGAGIAILQGTRICGGDPDFIYSGTYIVTADGRDLIADIDVSNHSGNRMSIFGPAEQFVLHIEGRAPTTSTVGTTIHASGRVSMDPNLQLLLLMTLRAKLP